MLSAETALKRLAEADDAELGQRLSPFLHALCEFEAGLALLTDAGRFVERQTAAGTPYDAAWRLGVSQCLKIRAPAHHVVEARVVWLGRFPRQQTLADDLAQVRDRLAFVIERCSLKPKQRTPLNAWWAAADTIIAHATNIHADACQRMLQSHLGGIDAAETHILGGFFGKLYAAEVKAAAARLTEELRLRLQSSAAPGYQPRTLSDATLERCQSASCGTIADKPQHALLSGNERDVPAAHMPRVSPDSEQRRPASEVPDLHKLDKKILPAMLDLDAKSEEKKAAAAKIARHIEKVAEATQPYAERLIELRLRGLVRSGRGRTGGYWLTPEGLRVANLLKGGNPR